MSHTFYGEIFYQDDNFTITWQQGMGMYMWWTRTITDGKGERLAQIIDGKKGLDKRYNGDVQKWIAFVKDRELKTMQSYRRQVEDLLRKARAIQENNNFTEDQFNANN